MENDLNTGTRGGIIGNLGNTSSNSEVVSDNEESSEHTNLIKNKLDGSLGGTPFDFKEDMQLDDNESNRSNEE